MFAPAEESQTFLQLTALCQDRTLVGMKLLEKISSVPHGELSCSKLSAIFLTCFGPEQITEKSSVWILVSPLHPSSSTIIYKFLVESHKFIKEKLENIYGNAAPNLKSHQKVTFSHLVYLAYFILTLPCKMAAIVPILEEGN